MSLFLEFWIIVAEKFGIESPMSFAIKADVIGSFVLFVAVTVIVIMHRKH